MQKEGEGGIRDGGDSERRGEGGRRKGGGPTFWLTVTEARWSAHFVNTSEQSLSLSVALASQAAVCHSPYVCR